MTNVKIERVSNGYIVEKNGTKQVHTDLNEMFDEIKRSITSKFSNQRPIYEFNYEIKQPNGE